MKKFARFVTKFYSEYWPLQPKTMREGQSLMVFLHKFDIEEYNKIASINYYNNTDIDCFYNDKLIGNTLAHLLNIWRAEV